MPPRRAPPAWRACWASMPQADALADAAEKLRQRFEDKFWCEEIGTYAIALDGDKKPCRVRTSNAGQVLFCGIASAGAGAARVAEALMTPEMFSGWGVRTMPSDAPRFNPMSYHDGSVWPHDNALIALGLARYGFKRAAAAIFTGLFDAAGHMELMRFPELFCGFPRRRGTAPTLYPVACAPQAWASAAPFALLEACLGLDCVSPSAKSASTIRCCRDSWRNPHPQSGAGRRIRGFAPSATARIPKWRSCPSGDDDQHQESHSNIPHAGPVEA